MEYQINKGVHMNGRQLEWGYTVSVQISVNGKDNGKKIFTSNESYDHCYLQLETYLRKNTSPDDEIIKDIISAHARQYVVYEHSSV